MKYETPASRAPGALLVSGNQAVPRKNPVTQMRARTNTRDGVRPTRVWPALQGAGPGDAGSSAWRAMPPSPTGQEFPNPRLRAGARYCNARPILSESSANTGEVLVFLINHHGFGASTITAIYKDRWQIELFFKALKRNLKIKTFVGTSANAAKPQIWTALYKAHREAAI